MFYRHSFGSLSVSKFRFPTFNASDPLKIFSGKSVSDHYHSFLFVGGSTRLNVAPYVLVSYTRGLRIFQLENIRCFDVDFQRVQM